MERCNAEKNLPKTALLQFTAKYVKRSYFEHAKTAKGNIYLEKNWGLCNLIFFNGMKLQEQVFLGLSPLYG